MQATSPAPVIFCFGVYELDSDGSELRREGHIVHLQPQPLQVLLRLVSHAGKIISREELQKCLWTDDTFVGYEDGVNHAINKIREALDDSAHNPRFVQTVPRLGYKFIAPVTQGGQTLGFEPEQPRHPIAFLWLEEHWRALIAFAAVVVVGFVLLQAKDWWNVRKAVHSIAVLPMSNFTEEPENDHLADAMTEELIARLSQVKNLRVISHTSVMRYKLTTKSLQEIGKEVRADAVIEGSVTTAGQFVRVTIKLVRTADEQQIWAAVYEQKRDEMVTLQDQLAAQVLQEIGVLRPTNIRPAERP